MRAMCVCGGGRGVVRGDCLMCGESADGWVCWIIRSIDMGDGERRHGCTRGWLDRAANVEGSGGVGEGGNQRNG